MLEQVRAYLWHESHRRRRRRCRRRKHRKMPALSTAKRREVWAEFMRENEDEFGAVNKEDLHDAVMDIDGWFVENQASLNQAIRQPARSELTVEQKALLGTLVIRMRYLEGV